MTVVDSENHILGSTIRAVCHNENAILTPKRRPQRGDPIPFLST